MDGRRAGLPLPGYQRAYPSTPPLGSRDHLFSHQPEAVLFPHGNPPCAEGAFRAAQEPTKGVGHVSRQGIFRRMDAAARNGWNVSRAVRGDVEQPLSILPDGERLLDNYDLCRMLNISKRTFQRYRTSGELPYEMIYHKTFYRESDVLRFIERNFSNFRKLKRIVLPVPVRPLSRESGVMEKRGDTWNKAVDTN